MFFYVLKTQAMEDLRNQVGHLGLIDVGDLIECEQGSLDLAKTTECSGSSLCSL